MKLVTKAEADAIRAGKPIRPPNPNAELLAPIIVEEQPEYHAPIKPITQEELDRNTKEMLAVYEAAVQKANQKPPEPKVDPTEEKNRIERLKRETKGGTVIPFRTPDYPQSQREYDAQRVATATAWEQQNAEAIAERGNQPIVRGCTTCDPASRKHGPDCVGVCELKWK